MAMQHSSSQQKMSMFNNNMGAGNQNQMPLMQAGGSFPQGSFPTNSSAQVGMAGGLGSFAGSRRSNGTMSGMASTSGMGTSVGGGVSGSVTGRPDRRSSAGVGSLPIDASSMSEMFGRRSSVGFDDSFFSRRESLDTSTAVIDACILDLTRRRISMAMGQSGGVTHDLGLPTSVGPSTGNPIPSATNVQSFAHQNAAASLAARQQQIQQQQMELDKRQKEIDMQRQQLLALHDSTLQQGGMGGSLVSSSIGSFGGLNNNHVSLMRMPTTLPSNSVSTLAGNDRLPQWWICQICNGRAFASRLEAAEHEAICADNRGGNQLLQHQQLQQQHQQHEQIQHHKIERQLPAPTPINQHNFSGMLQLGGNQDSLSDVLGDGGDEGPFAILPHPQPLAMPSDKDWLTPLHCFVRAQCVEVFCASSQDVATPSKGKRKPIQIGQVGIRCPHCHTGNSAAGQRERGSVYYPTTISSIYNATMNLLQRHLHSCSAVPPDVMQRYQTLKSDDARSGTSKKYWVESALSLGLVDTANGIRFSARRPPPLPRLSRQQHSTGMHSAERRNSNDFFSGGSSADNRNKDIDLSMATGFNDMDGDVGVVEGRRNQPQNESAEKSSTSTTPLVTLDDKPYATAFSYHLLSQMQPCVFTEADRLGKRKGLPAGFAGLACRHCFGGYGSGRFFPSSIKTLSDTSKTLNVLYNHMLRCRKCPHDVKETLEKLHVHHDDDRAKMKFGSQKAFFAKIWSRLHEKDSGTSIGRYTEGMKRKLHQVNLFSASDRMMGMGSIGPGMSIVPGSQASHIQMSNALLGSLDIMSRQGDAEMNKRQRIGH